MLSGIRRIGKTSVMKVTLKEIDDPYIIIDARALKPNYGRRELLLESYKYALKAIAQGKRSWSEIKEYMEKKEGVTISSSVLHNLIRNLEMMSIAKDYGFLDPVYEEASKKLCI
ncbi:MAG: hypothetical protein ACUVTL_10345 [Thermoproteota archaeon]